MYSSFFVFNPTATTEIYTLSLHDALPISRDVLDGRFTWLEAGILDPSEGTGPWVAHWERSEEHTSELQSRRDLVCRLLLEKKKIQRLAPAERGELLEFSMYPSTPHD